MTIIHKVQSTSASIWTGACLKNICRFHFCDPRCVSSMRIKNSRLSVSRDFWQFGPPISMRAVEQFWSRFQHSRLTTWTVVTEMFWMVGTILKEKPTPRDAQLDVSILQHLVSSQLSSPQTFPPEDKVRDGKTNCSDMLSMKKTELKPQWSDIPLRPRKAMVLFFEN